MTRSRGCAAAVLVAALVVMSCGSRLTACGARGGVIGAEAQLRFVDANDGQIVFTFGPSPVSDTFGVPAYTLEPFVGTGGLPTMRLTFRGASIRYPDGSASYGGPLEIGVNGPHVLDVALISDIERSTTWRITPKTECPRVWAKTYVYGKSPRAQLALTFGGMSAFTLESTSDFIGAPQDTPVQASGMGFAPSSVIVITAAERKMWDTTTDGEGNFDSGFNIGYPAPGIYTVTASDPKGHRGVTRLTVILPTNPFR